MEQGEQIEHGDSNGNGNLVRQHYCPVLTTRLPDAVAHVTGCTVGRLHRNQEPLGLSECRRHRYIDPEVFNLAEENAHVVEKLIVCAWLRPIYSLDVDGSYLCHSGLGQEKSLLTCMVMS